MSTIAVSARKIILAAVMSSGLVSAAVFGAVSAAQWGHIPSKDHTRTNPFDQQPEAVSAGAFLYRQHCEQCHKADAQGDGRKKPSLKSDRIRTATDGDLEWFLRQGDLRHGMPSWSGLPEAQRWQLIAYLRSLH